MIFNDFTLIFDRFLPVRASHKQDQCKQEDGR